MRKSLRVLQFIIGVYFSSLGILRFIEGEEWFIYVAFGFVVIMHEISEIFTEQTKKSMKKVIEIQNNSLLQLLNQLVDCAGQLQAEVDENIKLKRKQREWN